MDAMAHGYPLKCFLVKLVMAGDSSVGKTSVLRRYVDDPDPSFIATIGIDFKIKTLTIDETMLKLQIWDTAGQERFHTLSREGEDAEIILLGNKCDKEEARAVSKEKGEKLAWEYGIPFFETSAINNINIDQAFSTLVEAIYSKKASLQLAADTVNLRESKKKDSCCNT
uniref:small monomeric GTPase n=1 Tax=Geotrypetes seraphini TaxID=260995 RepID=A0A6P8PTB0_GEOSA|nr:ras-related protein Rab-10-like isoform X2 [Geotrypetes seraphini]